MIKPSLMRPGLPFRVRSTVPAVGLLLLAFSRQAAAQDLNEQLEKSIKDAARKVAPSVVQVITSGGTDMVVTTPKGPVFRKALGPTTGVIVSADGYVISSSFNFINNPTTILVAVPGQKEPLVAKRVAADKSRFLTLLKIEAKGLPVPTSVPAKELRVGQWSIALGRTLDTKRDGPPSISVGVVSALGRIWGRCVQTDAKISPFNYGGPIVDIQGRVQGILIPASPQQEGVTSGFEWYDSGIGFAVPMADVLAVLPRLQKGKDIDKGVLGVRMKDPDVYGAAPEIADVAKGSAADKAGLKPGDVIVEMEASPVVRMAQIMHILGARYAGDKVSLKFKRGDKLIDASNLELVGASTAYAHPFLGILPVRDDPKLGVQVRYVFPKSPADAAGLKAGDRITKVGLGMGALNSFSGQVRSSAELADFLNNLAPDTEIKVEFVRGEEKPQTVTLKLDDMPGSTSADDLVIPATLPEPASLRKALEPLVTPKGKTVKIDAPAKGETGIIERKVTSGKSWLYVHEDYDPNITHSLLVWLHPPGKQSKEEIEDVFITFEDYCKENHIIVLCPISDNEAGWIASEADFVLEAIKDVTDRYHIDRERIVAHGMGVGGQMAIYLGFNARETIRGVAAVGAVTTTPRENLQHQRLHFFLAGGDRDPLIKEIAQSRKTLVERRFPVAFRELKDRGREYLDDGAIRELIRWIDSLDRR